LSAKERDASLQEVDLLSRLNHPNIVEYKANFFMGETLVIIMQYCEGGDLATYIKDMLRNKMRIQQVQIMNYLVQVLQALQYIHGEKILHRDLKSSNLFLMKSMSVVKLGDFGISRVLEGTAEAAMTVVGTPYYMSPEVCENKPYTYKSDVWSLGCVLYELCMLKHAFSADNLLGLVYKIVRDEYGPIPKLYSHELNRLIKGMLEKQAEKRPSVRDLLADTYVQSYMNEYVRTRGQCATPAAAGSSARATPVATTSSAEAARPEGGAVERLPTTAAAASSQSGRGGPRPVRRSQQRLIAAGAVPRRPPRQQKPVSAGVGGLATKFETPKEAMARRRREAADKQAAQLQAATKEALQNKSVARDMKQKQFHAMPRGSSGSVATLSSETATRTHEDDYGPQELPDETSPHDDGYLEYDFDSYTEDEYEDDFEEDFCTDDGEEESEFEEDHGDDAQGGGAYLREEQDAQRVFENYERATALASALASPPFKRNSSAEQTPRTATAMHPAAASSADVNVGTCLDLQSRAAKLREELIRKMGEETFQKAFDFVYDARSQNKSFSRKEMETIVGKDLYPCCFDVDQLVYHQLCCS